jgi:NADPH:quinone reductase
MHAATAPDLPARHRAWRWHGDAAPLALRPEAVALAAPQPGQVLVRNAAIGLNPVDWKVLAGGLVDWRPGHVPGVDGAGRVVALGAGVGAHWFGRRVAYHASLHAPGSFAEYTAVDARALLAIPDALDAATAASLPCPALTAALALAKLPLRGGDSVLLAGAGGAVGHYFVQLAARRNLAVTAMCHPRHWDRLPTLGALACIPGPLPAERAWDDPARFHAVIDCVGGTHATRLVPALRANGHLVCIQDRVPGWPTPPFGRALSLHEVALGALHVHGDDQDWARLREVGTALLADLADGRLHAEPLRLGDFDGLAALLEALRRRDFSGKPVVRLPDPTCAGIAAPLPFDRTPP